MTEAGTVIYGFGGAWRFLSNFWYEEDGKTAEHRFQAYKCVHEAEKEWVMSARTPAEAKLRGRKVTLRSDWEDIKLDVMRYVLAIKFGQKELALKLLSTGDADLIEANTWGDVYWGVDIKTGKGENHLGKLLVETRARIRETTNYGH